MAPRTDPYLPTLGNSIAGHLMEAVVQGLVVFVVLLLMRFLAPAHATGVGTLLIMGLLSCAVSGVVVACCERPATVREQHPAPGGWGFAIWWFVVPPVVGAVVGHLESTWWSVACAGAMLLVLGAEALWMKPWQRGLSATEQHEKFEQLRQVINEDRLEDGWVGPARDQVRRHHHD